MSPTSYRTAPPRTYRYVEPSQRTSTDVIRVSTFSIVACDSSARELGVAVQSKFIAVGAVVPWLEADVGAIATQAWANTTYGPSGLELLRRGVAPADVIAELTRDDAHADQRQVGVVDARGHSATYTGAKCMEWAGGVAAVNFSAQGNILAGQAVVDALATSFTSTSGVLADRLIAALRAAQAAGGDRRGKQSAALVIVKPKGGYAAMNDRFVDLRVDDHPDPVEELARILELYKLYFFKPAPEDVLDIDTALGREVVEHLKRAGALPEAAPQEFDCAAEAALVRFMHRENLEERVREDGRIDKQSLAYLRSFGA